MCINSMNLSYVTQDVMIVRSYYCHVDIRAACRIVGSAVGGRSGQESGESALDDRVPQIAQTRVVTG